MKISFEKREKELKNYLIEHNSYSMHFYQDFNFSVLKKVNTFYKRAGGHSYFSNECIIMGDTETSKNPDHKNESYENHLVAWTISIRAAGENIVTLYGSDPESHIETIQKIHDTMRGDRTYIFYHNLSYDWVFLRRFFIDRFGEPERQLNTKPHYPISIEFDNGIILRDSLIIAQRSLEKWANDLNVEHKKAVNEWDYTKIRNQGGTFTDSELEYIEHDTLAGVECLDAMRKTLNKHICTLPYTATGVVREHFRRVAKRRDNRGRDWFLRQFLDYEFVKLSEDVYHGGYTHQNRFLKNDTIDGFYTDGELIQCYDIASSYPFCLCSEKYPCSKFVKYPDCKPEEILNACDNWAFMFTVEFYRIRLKDPLIPMPVLQYSKAYQTVNEVADNGRITEADYVCISLCDVDLKLIAQQYEWNTEYTVCRNVIVSPKDYLPKWFTDFVYNLFKDKTMLKGGDPVLYALSKSKLNSCYGMCCQHVMQNDIVEDYETGEFTTTIIQTEESYQKYIDNKNTFLPYQIGIYCTAYAVKNLFELGSCLKDKRDWIYSDTDSCFGFGWDLKKIKKYNDVRIKLMKLRGYEGIEHNGRLYYMGIAELDKECTEFRGIHSKCYCYRDAESGELKITVAGVPKKGAKCLHNNIENFKPGFIFPGSETGKLTHTYIFNDRHIDEYGNEIADSIDLSPCDYLINDISHIDWNDLISEEIEIGRDYEQ